MTGSLTPARSSADEAEARPERRRARMVTYGAVALLLVVAAVQLEAWPLTSYRLFSSVRTGEGASSSLVAVGQDGSRTPVAVPPGNEVLPTTAHLYDELARAKPEQQRAMVHTWLDIAGIDPAAVSSVRLESVRWRLDRESLERIETGRTLVAEVEL